MDRKSGRSSCSVATLLFLADCRRVCRSAGVFDRRDFVASNLVVLEEKIFRARQWIPVEEGTPAFVVGAPSMLTRMILTVLFAIEGFGSPDRFLLIPRCVLELRHVEYLKSIEAKEEGFDGVKRGLIVL